MRVRAARQAFRDFRSLQPRRRLRRHLALAFAREIGFFRFLALTRYDNARIRSHADRDEGTKEVEYSAAWLARYAPDDRIGWTMSLLAAIPDCGRESLLILGPRYETELIMARGHGWRDEGIRALDTHSYSRRIDIGDMHAMPYADDAFDAVLCGWTLSYSTRPETAAKEIQRVMAPGGYLVIAMQKVSDTFTGVLPSVLKGAERIQTLGQLDELFSGLRRVAGFEPDVADGGTGETVAAYRKDETSGLR